MADDSLIREVDEEVRRERMERLWRHYRLPLALAALALVLVTAGASIWRNMESKRAGEAMARLERAIHQLEAEKPAQAAQAFAALAKDSDGSLRDIARLWQARALAQAAQAESALAAWRDLAEHPAGADLFWRDRACLQLMTAGAELPSPCVAASASPLKVTRMEWRAAQLWGAGKRDDARALLDTLGDDADATPAQRMRIARLRAALVSEAP